MNKQVIEKIKVEIERYTRLNCPDEVKRYKAQLRRIRSHWRKYCQLPFVQMMKDIVEKHVEHYHVDFYDYDFGLMEKYGDAVFLWHVYPCGTNYCVLEGDEEMIEERQPWFNALRREYSHEGEMKPNHLLFIVDPRKGTVTPIQGFEQVTFTSTQSPTQLFAKAGSM